VKTEFNGEREESKSHGAHRIGAMAGPEEEIGDLERYKLRHRRVAFERSRKSVRAVAFHKEVFEVE